jgi:hypothetical protein
VSRRVTKIFFIIISPTFFISPKSTQHDKAASLQPQGSLSGLCASLAFFALKKAKWMPEEALMEDSGVSVNRYRDLTKPASAGSQPLDRLVKVGFRVGSVKVTENKNVVRFEFQNDLVYFGGLQRSISIFFLCKIAVEFIVHRF